jgi:methyltransferase (TIGR00027 family)
MIEGKPSFTAAWVAGGRALGTLLPDAARLATDPYGARFCSPAFAALVDVARRLPPLRPLVLTPAMTWVAYMQVRTRAIDDVLRAFVAGGGRQVVILGAGFDARAARFAAELAGGRVYEVDHPATQWKKRGLMAGEAQADVAYLAWNFETQPMSSLPAALSALGLDRGRPVLTIWEGVTMYLTEPAIEASLAAIRAFGAAGSPLVFDYKEKARVAAPRGPMRLVSRAVRGIGEPHIFGWDPPALPAWLRERGFALESDRSARQLAEQLAPQWAHVTERVGNHTVVAHTTR